MKILVADDDETIRALLTRLFVRRGESVEAAVDGAAAIACLETAAYDLLILDLMMPRTDGLGVLAYLRNRAVPSPAVIVITAAVPSLAASVPKDQVAAVVTKPFEITSLIQIAADAVNGQGARAEG
ncbi:MAG TPA: response regulator [Thermoanaerobaculia bacterium]|nr:response regulator [Thermoanaerobaculia bacterium]